MAFIKLITIVGGAATTAFLPMPSTKAKLVTDFLCLIYDHKSMMINTDETSYWWVSAKYLLSEYIDDFFFYFIKIFTS
jgi:hypothetical protein